MEDADPEIQQENWNLVQKTLVSCDSPMLAAPKKPTLCRRIGPSKNKNIKRQKIDINATFIEYGSDPDNDSVGSQADNYNDNNYDDIDHNNDFDNNDDDMLDDNDDNNDNNDDTIQCFDNYSAKQWIAYLTTKYKMSSAISRHNPLCISKNDKIAFKKIFKALFDKADFETQLLLKLWKSIIETGIPGTTDPHAQEQSRY